MHPTFRFELPPWLVNDQGSRPSCMLRSFMGLRRGLVSRLRPVVTQGFNMFLNKPHCLSKSAPRTFSMRACSHVGAGASLPQSTQSSGDNLRYDSLRTSSSGALLSDNSVQAMIQRRVVSHGHSTGADAITWARFTQMMYRKREQL